ncbi:O-methyltransferase [Penicillium angulare]|uniref:O-methyltransferase n=1 Tax=Penicillium angulare TaxID=116970 RepID=UPI00254189DE|nr:O-methyltransferase [Penicillium angulare]KAJ5280365.1 O-methyltransferase [Penicillium angulare]
MATNCLRSNGYIGDLNQLCQDADVLGGELSESDRLSSLKLAQELTRLLEKPRDAMLKMSFSPAQIVAVRVAIDMRIFIALAEKDTPLTLDELAAVKNANPILTGWQLKRRAERVLRLLSAIGYVIENDVRLYSANDITREMSTRLGSATIRLIIMITLAKIPEWIRQMKFQNPPGSNGAFQYAENTGGGGIWDYLLMKPELSDDFNTFMEASSADRPYWGNWFPVQERLLDEYTGGAGDALLVDIAGGKGHDIKRFHANFPVTPGRLFLQDQDHVLAEAEIGDHIEKNSIDLFQPQPVRGKI